MRISALFRRLLLTVGALLLALPALAEEPLLTVSGAIEGGERSFTRAELEAMPQTAFDTATVWTEGVDHYRGVRLQALLEAVGAHGATLRFTAVNDYAVDIAADEPTLVDATLAYEFNGAPMTRRGKGPVWLVWPYDSSAEYRTEAVYARSVWQLVRIEIMD